MILQQVLYGSLTGSRNYDIIACSGGVAAGDRAKIADFSNLGGSAQAMAEAAVTYAFYPLDDNQRWAFAQTTIFGYGKRGNEYLVHALVLDRGAMAAIGGDVFALAQAGAFEAWKPAQAQQIDPRNVSSRDVKHALARPLPAVDMPVALLISALGAQRLAVCVDEVDDGRAVCETVHRILPPSDRAQMSFCTYFSYPKVLPFRLTAFVPADHDLVAEYLIRRGAVYFDPSTARSTREVEKWVSGREKRETLWGISVLGDARRALAIEDRIAEWHAAATQGRATVATLLDESPVGREAAAVLRIEQNADAASAGTLTAIIPATLLLVELQSVAAGAPIDVQRLADIARSLPNATAQWLLDAERAAAASADSVVMETAKVIVWLAREHGEAMLDIVVGRSTAFWFQSLHSRNARAALAVLTHIFRAWRTSKTDSISEVVDLAIALSRDSELIRTIVAAAEAAADRDGKQWLLRIVREILQLQADVPATAIARIAIDHDLLPSLEEHEVALVLPELLTHFGSRFYEWASGVSAPGSFREHAARAVTELLLLRGGEWQPFASSYDEALIAWFSAPDTGEDDPSDSLTRTLLLWVASMRIGNLGDPSRTKRIATLLAANLVPPENANSMTHQVAIHAATRFCDAGAAAALPARGVANAIRGEKTSWPKQPPSLASIRRIYDLENPKSATGARR